jgi:hypothetical protein
MKLPVLLNSGIMAKMSERKEMKSRIGSGYLSAFAFFSMYLTPLIPLKSSS